MQRYQQEKSKFFTSNSTKEIFADHSHKIRNCSHCIMTKGSAGQVETMITLFRSKVKGYQ